MPACTRGIDDRRVAGDSIGVFDIETTGFNPSYDRVAIGCREGYQEDRCADSWVIWPRSIARPPLAQ